MRPAAFEYFSPETIEEALDLIGEDARPLAGGQSLIALMNLRFATPDSLVDLQNIPDLTNVYIKDNCLSIGAMASQSDVEKNLSVVESAPLVSEGISEIGHWQIRTRGTVGGNLAHSDPASELPAVMVALNAKYCLATSTSEREVSAIDFHLGAYDTLLESNELLTRIVVPVQKPSQRSALKETVRAAGAYAIAGATAVVERELEKCTSAKIVLFGTGSKPFEVTDLEDITVERKVDPDFLATLEEHVLLRGPSFEDLHATVEQRKQMHASLAKRAFLAAWNKFEQERK